MRKYLALTRIYIESVYGFSGFLENFKKGRKGILKAIGILLLVLYCLGASGSIFLMLNLKLYEALKPYGMEKLLFLISLVMATGVSFILGFMTCLSSYFLSESEVSLLSLPLRPWELFASKFSMSYIAEFLLSSLILLITIVVYAINASPPPLYYLYSLFIILAVPVFPLCAVYLVLVPLMRAGRMLRNKNLILMIGGILGIVFALGFQIVYQRLLMNGKDGSWLFSKLAGPDSLIARVGIAYPPSFFAAQALAYSGEGKGFLNLFFLILLSGLVLLGEVAVLSGPYAKSLLGFNESFLRRMKSSEAYISRIFKRRGRFLALFLREFTMMNREPAFFLNGPFIVVLMPILFAVMAFAQGENLLVPLKSALDSFDASLVLPWIAAAFGGFLGCATSIASTSVSREGRLLSFILSLPVKASEFFGAKYAHHLFFALLGAVIGTYSVSFLYPLSFGSALLAVFAGFSFSSFMGITGLFLDTAFPKLSWTSPGIAIKQNMNSVLSLLASMGMIGALGILVAILGPRLWMLPLIASVFLILSAAAWLLYIPFAEKRLSMIE